MTTVLMEVPASAAVQVPFLRFPPFPAPPPGVNIIPFKDFKEHGIQMFNDNEVELCGLGIPTVELRVKHDADECKTNSRRRKKTPAGEGSEMKKKEWWETWAEGEDLRGPFTYDTNESDLERIHQAAADFRKSRVWPPQSAGLSALWDQFRLFAGLLSNPPVWRKAEPNKAADEDDDDSLSEEGVDGGVILDVASRQPAQHLRPRPPYSNYGQTPTTVTSDEMVRELLEAAEVQKDARLETFISDPVTRTKAFLSSYMRDQGLIWSDRNLTHMPHLISFFYNFVVRHRALPEHERAFRYAIEAIEVAKVELPLTSAIAKALPGDFSKACEMRWGRHSGGFESPTEYDNQDASGATPGFVRSQLGLSPAGVEDAKQGVDNPTPENDFDAELKAARLQVVDVSQIDIMKDCIEDNLSDAWATGTDTRAWGDAPTAWDAPDVSGWAGKSTASLTSFLESTSLPRTHSPGIVEWSMRRIKSIIPPQAQSSPPFDMATDCPSPEAVEAKLREQYARMVLEPWLDWDATQKQGLSAPTILPKSRGPVVDDGAGIDDGRARRGHDKMKDDITVLVPPSASSILHVGMGLGATWIELARSGRDLAQSQVIKNGKKTKGAKRAEKYWYMEQLMTIIPSYYTT